MDDWKRLRQEEIIFIYGIDTLTHPVVYFKTKNMHPAKWPDLKEWETNVIACLQYVSVLCDAIGKDRKMTVVVDRREAGYKNFSKAMVKAIVNLASEYYIERLYKAFIAPTSFAFKLIWKFVCLFLDKRT